MLGSTGAGKSTIMNLLCRFVDATSGEVLVDGVNVKDWNLYDLRDNIGMAMQDIFLFLIQLKGILHTVVRTVHLRKFTKLLSWQMPTISSRLCPKAMIPSSASAVSDSPAVRSSVFPCARPVKETVHPDSGRYYFRR
ncbi:MAG: ATP-binding cassette domain-containing protein [Gallintestinimicrobium sp.]